MLPRNTLREERDRLKDEVLKLREDNRKLRKEIIELRVENEELLHEVQADTHGIAK